MTRQLVSTLLFALVLVGCNAGESTRSEPAALVGSDRDEHGCIGSAGYQWCARTAQCERSWELAKRAGFDNTLGEFTRYCSE